MQRSVLLAAFIVWVVRRTGAALVDVHLLTAWSVLSSSTAVIFLGAALFTSVFRLLLYFQALHSCSVPATAWMLVQQGVGSLLARFVAGMRVDKFGAWLAVGLFVPRRHRPVRPCRRRSEPLALRRSPVRSWSRPGESSSSLWRPPPTSISALTIRPMLPVSLASPSNSAVRSAPLSLLLSSPQWLSMRIPGISFDAVFWKS